MSMDFLECFIFVDGECASHAKWSDKTHSRSTKFTKKLSKWFYIFCRMEGDCCDEPARLVDILSAVVTHHIFVCVQCFRRPDAYFGWPAVYFERFCFVFFLFSFRFVSLFPYSSVILCCRVCFIPLHIFFLLCWSLCINMIWFISIIVICIQCHENEFFFPARFFGWSLFNIEICARPFVLIWCVRTKWTKHEYEIKEANKS